MENNQLIRELQEEIKEAEFRLKNSVERLKEDLENNHYYDLIRISEGIMFHQNIIDTNKSVLSKLNKE